MNTPTVDELEIVLRRIPIPRGQVTLLKALYDAADFVPRSTLVEDLRWGDAKGFQGVLSAFSNRINQTQGLSEKASGYRAFVEVRRENGDDGRRMMRLRPEARRAVERVPALMAAIERPMEELLEGVTVKPGDLSVAERLVRVSGVEPVEPWSPTTPEDRLLAAYWDQVGGTIVTEVETGGSGPAHWPEGSRRRRIDGVRFLSADRDEIVAPNAFSREQLCQIVRRRHVEVIEVKKNLNRPVIGQAIAGVDLFERDYAPATVEPVVVAGRNDPALAWVCRRNGVRVEIVKPRESE